jgi:hypothetical protein
MAKAAVPLAVIRDKAERIWKSPIRARESLPIRGYFRSISDTRK